MAAIISKDLGRPVRAVHCDIEDRKAWARDCGCAMEHYVHMRALWRVRFQVRHRCHAQGRHRPASDGLPNVRPKLHCVRRKALG